MDLISHSEKVIVRLLRLGKYAQTNYAASSPGGARCGRLGSCAHDRTCGTRHFWPVCLPISPRQRALFACART